MGSVLIWLAKKVVDIVLETFKPEIQTELRRLAQWLRRLF